MLRCCKKRIRPIIASHKNLISLSGFSARERNKGLFGFGDTSTSLVSRFL